MHALAQPADGPLFLDAEHVLEGLIPLHGKVRIKSPVKAHHIPDGSLGEIVPVVRDIRHPGLQAGIFPHVLSADTHRAGILTENAGEMADQRGFARAVGAHQTVHAARRHCKRGAGERRKAVKPLHQIPYLDHASSSSFKSASSSVWVTPRYRSSASISRVFSSSSSRRAASAPVSPAAKLPLPGTE